jgi:hypothetical protein
MVIAAYGKVFFSVFSPSDILPGGLTTGALSSENGRSGDWTGSAEAFSSAGGLATFP